MKTRWTFFLCLLFLGGIITAQNSKNVSLGFNFGLKQTREILKNNGLVESQNSPGINFGIDVYFQPNEILSVKSGINYTFLQVERFDYSLTFGSDLTPNGFDYYNSWTENKINGHFIGIPIETRLYLVGDKNRFYVKPGFEAMLLLSQNAKSYLVESKVNRSGPSTVAFGEFIPLLFLVDFGLGYEFTLPKGFQVYLEPLVEYSLNKIFKDSNSVGNSRILNLGLVAGTRF